MRQHSWHTSVAVDAVVIIDEFLQEGLVLFQDIIAHVWDVVEESLIFNLPQEEKDTSKDTYNYEELL